MAEYSSVNGKDKGMAPGDNQDEIPFREALRILARIVADKHLSTFDDSVGSLVDGKSTDSPEQKETKQPEDGKEE